MLHSFYSRPIATLWTTVGTRTEMRVGGFSMLDGLGIYREHDFI